MNKLGLIAAGVLLFLVCMVGCSTCTLVGPKEAGFKVKRGGSYRGVDNIPLITGYNWYIPWLETVEKVPTTMHHVVWSDDKSEGEPEDQSIQIFCNGGAGFHVNVGLNVSVIPNEAPHMWIRWGTLDVDVIMKTYLRNVVRGNMQNVSSMMSVDSVLNNFNALESACRISIQDSLQHYGFHLDGFNILSKPRAVDTKLEEAINGKIIARQLAEKSVMEKQTTQAEADKKVITARGDSAAYVIEKAGTAYGISLLQSKLSPLYIDYLKYIDIDPSTPRVPQYVGAGGWVMQGK